MWDRRKIGSSPPSDVDAFSHGAPRSRWTLLSLRYRRRRRQVCQEVKNSVGCSWRVPTSTKKFVRTSAPAGWRRSSSEKSERSVIFPNTLIPRRTLNPPRKKTRKNPPEKEPWGSESKRWTCVEKRGLQFFPVNQKSRSNRVRRFVVTRHKTNWIK